MAIWTNSTGITWELVRNTASQRASNLLNWNLPLHQIPRGKVGTLNTGLSEVKSLSRVWLFATPWTIAYQAPPSMGFSRQECWSGLPFPSPKYWSAAAAAAKSLQSCPTLCDPTDGSPPGSPVPGILQTRTLECLLFPSPMHESEKWKWSHSVMSDSSRPHGLQPTRLLRPWDFSRQEYWSGVPSPSLKYWSNRPQTLLFPPNKLQASQEPPGLVYKPVYTIASAIILWNIIK